MEAKPMNIALGNGDAGGRLPLEQFLNGSRIPVIFVS